MSTFAILTNFEESGATVYIYLLLQDAYMDPIGESASGSPSKATPPSPPSRQQRSGGSLPPSASDSSSPSAAAASAPPPPMEHHLLSEEDLDNEANLSRYIIWAKFPFTLSLTHTLLQLQPGGPPGPCTKRGEQPQGGQPHVLALPGPDLRGR